MQAFVTPSVNAVTIQQSTVSENRYMVAQSSTSNVSIPLLPILPANLTDSFPSTSLFFDNNILTFQHQCLSSLSNAIPNCAWVIDSGVTMHACSDLSLFTHTSFVSGVTASLLNGIGESISHIVTMKILSSLVWNCASFYHSFSSHLGSFIFHLGTYIAFACEFVWF